MPSPVPVFELAIRSLPSRVGTNTSLWRRQDKSESDQANKHLLKQNKHNGNMCFILHVTHFVNALMGMTQTM
jgi:DNA-binding phage protein